MKKFLSALLVAALCLSAFGCARKPDTNPAEDLAGLKGKVVYNMPGQGQVTDLTFRYILKSNRIDYVLDTEPHAGKVALAYAETAETILGLLTDKKAYYGIVAEPGVTSGLAANDKLSLFLDVQQLYADATGQTDGWPQACLVVKSDFYNANPAYVRAFAEMFASAGTWLEANPDAALTAVQTAGSTAITALTAETAKRCNIGFVDAAASRPQLETFLAGVNGVVLPDEGETAVQVPDDAFYAPVPTVDADASLGKAAEVYVPDGAPTLAVAEMLNIKFAGANFHVVPAKTIGPNVLNNADLAVMPCTAAANLYKQSKGKIRMLGLATFGNMYMLKA